MSLSSIVSNRKSSVRDKRENRKREIERKFNVAEGKRLAKAHSEAALEELGRRSREAKKAAEVAAKADEIKKKIAELESEGSDSSSSESSDDDEDQSDSNSNPLNLGFKSDWMNSPIGSMIAQTMMNASIAPTKED